MTVKRWRWQIAAVLLVACVAAVAIAARSPLTRQFVDACRPIADAPWLLVVWLSPALLMLLIVVIGSWESDIGRSRPSDGVLDRLVALKRLRPAGSAAGTEFGLVPIPSPERPARHRAREVPAAGVDVLERLAEWKRHRESPDRGDQPG